MVIYLADRSGTSLGYDLDIPIYRLHWAEGLAAGASLFHTCRLVQLGSVRALYTKVVAAEVLQLSMARLFSVLLLNGYYPKTSLLMRRFLRLSSVGVFSKGHGKDQALLVPPSQSELRVLTWTLLEFLL